MYIVSYLFSSFDKFRHAWPDDGLLKLKLVASQYVVNSTVVLTTILFINNVDWRMRSYIGSQSNIRRARLNV
jgi:hypothetical protein